MRKKIKQIEDNDHTIKYIVPANEDNVKQTVYLRFYLWDLCFCDFSFYFLLSVCLSLSLALCILCLCFLISVHVNKHAVYRLSHTIPTYSPFFSFALSLFCSFCFNFFLQCTVFVPRFCVLLLAMRASPRNWHNCNGINRRQRHG